MMDLKDYREKIDSIDEQLVKLFSERMEIAGQIAQYKKENNKPILDVTREREKLLAVSDMTSEEMRAYSIEGFSMIYSATYLVVFYGIALLVAFRFFKKKDLL